MAALNLNSALTVENLVNRKKKHLNLGIKLATVVSDDKNCCK